MVAERPHPVLLERMWLARALENGWTPKEARFLLEAASEGGRRYGWAPPVHPIRGRRG
jgi:hypothetical protein